MKSVDSFPLSLQAVTLRPDGVVVVSEGEAVPDGCAGLVVPTDASPRRRAVVDIICMEASLRLAIGDSYDFSVCKLAIGRDWLTDKLEDRGFYVDRNTSADDLAWFEDLGGITRVAQLEGWYDREDEVSKRGCFVYALNLVWRACGDLAKAAVSAAERARRAWVPTIATVRGIGQGSRVEKCLKAAIERAEIGNRNDLGAWLTRRCKASGLSYDQTMKVMKRYRESVPESRSYTPREVEATVASRFRPSRPSRPAAAAFVWTAERRAAAAFVFGP